MFSFLKFMSVLPLVTTFRTIFGTSLRTRTVEMITWTIPIRFVWQKKKHVETSSQKLKGCGSSEFARFKQARKLQATLPSPKLWITYLLTYSLTAVRCRATSVAKKFAPGTLRKILFWNLICFGSKYFGPKICYSLNWTILRKDILGQLVLSFFQKVSETNPPTATVRC